MKRQRRPLARVRLALRKLIEAILPLSMKHALLRRFIKLDFNPSPRLRVKLATTKDELEAAFRLLHDSYVDAGFMDPHPSGMRVTKYHALPATTTIIALWDDKIVGTVSLVRRSNFGMPLETIFDVSQLTKDGRRVFETSSLAVDKTFSGQHGIILFALIKYLFTYGARYFGSTYMAIAVNPAWIEFYRAAFGFKLLSAKTVDSYSFVKGAPAVGAYLDLETVENHIKKVYRYARKRSNMHEYIFKFDAPNFEYPERNFTKISDPVLTPDLLETFFKHKTDAFAQMSENEIFILHQLYRNDDFRKVLPQLPKSAPVYRLRERPRIEVSLPAKIQIPGHAALAVLLTDVTSSGLGIVSERALRHGQIYDLITRIDETDHRLQVTLQWMDDHGTRSGLRVVDPSGTWTKFAKLLTDDLFRKSA